MGCSEPSSTAPASRSTSSSAGPAVTTLCTVITPVVRVPVLSRTTARTRPADSSAWALLTRMPSSAPRPTAASRAVGVASPSAHGHATTSTATAALQAAAAGRPAPSQKPSVAVARAITHGTNTAAIWSASRCALALVPCAWLTRRVIWASSVSAPTRVARTTNFSPTTSEAAGTRCSIPSRSTATVLAPRAASADSADPDLTLARASRYRPASTAVVTPAAASRYRVCPLACPNVKANDIRIPVMPAPPNSSAYTDQPNDAATPTLTRVSIVAAPWPSPYHAARCSGQAPHTATGAASARLTHCQPVNCADGTMASTMTAAVSGTQTASRPASARDSGSAWGAPSMAGGTGSSAV